MTISPNHLKSTPNNATYHLYCIQSRIQSRHRINLANHPNPPRKYPHTTHSQRTITPSPTNNSVHKQITPTTRTTNTLYEILITSPSSLHEHNSPSPQIKFLGPLTPTLIMNPSFYIPPPYPFPECWKALPEGSGATPWMACKGIAPHETQEIPPKKQENNEEEAHYKAFLGFAIHG